MTSNEIREKFIDFFKDKNHTFVPSSPVVPLDDPTLLFTNAGMNQFKDIFLGKGKRSYSRAVNTQKCIRVSGKHNDLEEVGHDTYHHTFFEMLGNWSFGDYYKKEAIKWAWELFTEIYKLPKNKLYATVYRDDNEAENLWSKETDISKNKILRFDEKDNFWEMGEVGPCGPCSEIHIDLGPDFCDKNDQEHTCFVNGDCGRYIELWNLVFIQYNRESSGELVPLPAKHVDTGAGFERIVAVLQEKQSNYDTDLFKPILIKIGEIVDRPYEQAEDKSPYHVIADHVRMLTFSIADGGFPSNDGRGYVMRRILRRAARYGRKLGMHQPFIYKVVNEVVNVLGDVFPEIKEQQSHVEKVILTEEEHFNRTLDRGLEIFEKIKNELQENKQIIIPGSYVFKLYDTYGFPLDLTRILAEENNLKMDEKGFEKEMQQQQLRARESAKFKAVNIDAKDWIAVNEGESSNFVGYTDDAIETHVAKYMIKENKLNIVLKDTPFYAESGGQIGDTGIIAFDGIDVKVIDTQKDGDEIIHICKLPENFELKNDRVFAEIFNGKRRLTEKNHTATHLLHKALRKVLGEHVQQAGSLVEPDRLRFDFTHMKKVTPDQITKIEQIVNDKIQEDIFLEIAQDTFENAKKRGAMALFGEKYGDVVRTVQVEDFSLELCGGTHVKRTGEIGPFIIIYEGSIASGIRRIEALTGRAAIDFMQKSRSNMTKISDLLNTQQEKVTDKIESLLLEKKKLEKQVRDISSDSLVSGIEDMLKSAETINGINLIRKKIPNLSLDQLKEIGDNIREKSKNTVALIGTKNENKLTFVCTVSDDLIKTKKLKAGDLVREVAKVAGGGGGGKPHLATAGGKDANKFDQAMEKIQALLK
ncbi:alanine--tRNA ligase [Calditrichota bacterium]